ncbi:MAG TPA: chemotaxis protein CheC [Candidatus Acidoferrales bacterium]|nr:chemotaxis protein CheC [Candidatus Acidoferrales bacterium]
MSEASGLTELQIDALKEIANIGAGHAATALSQLLNSTVKLEVPNAELMRYSDLDTKVADERIKAISHVYVRGDIPGHLVVLFDHQDALEFVGLFLQRVNRDLQIFDALVETTLKEIANIVASSYLEALVRLTGANMLPSVPVISYGSMRATFDTLMPLAPNRDIFFVESTFVDRGTKISGRLIFVPDTGSLQPLLAAFGA